MAGHSRWIRLDADWMHREWMIGQPDHMRLTWVYLLCYVESCSRGGGMIDRKSVAVMAGAMQRPPESLSLVMELASAGETPDLLLTENTVQVLLWTTKYHPTSADRVKAHRERERQKRSLEEEGATPVTGRNVTGVASGYEGFGNPTKTETDTKTEEASKEASGDAAPDSKEEGKGSPPLFVVTADTKPPKTAASPGDNPAPGSEPDKKERAPNHAFDPVYRVLLQAAEVLGWEDPPEADDVRRAIGKNESGALPKLIDKYGEDGALAMFTHARTTWRNPATATWEAIYNARNQVVAEMSVGAATVADYSEADLEEMAR